MTDPELAAWMAGRDDAARAARAMARRIRGAARGCPVAASNAATLEQYADSLPELPGAYEPTGLEYRGG
jgi:hypothetical protein